MHPLLAGNRAKKGICCIQWGWAEQVASEGKVDLNPFSTLEASHTAQCHCHKSKERKGEERLLKWVEDSEDREEWVEDKATLSQLDQLLLIGPHAGGNLLILFLYA